MLDLSSGSATTFFKMPKTGSSSVELLLEGTGVSVVQHESPVAARQALKAAEWSFCFVRNPFWRLVSAWNWVVHAPTTVNEHHRQAQEEIRKLGEFDAFVAHLDTVSRGPYGIHFLPMSGWICEDGELLVQRLCRYEDFEQELRDLWRERDLEPVDFGRLRRRVFLGVTDQSEYAQFYDSEALLDRVTAFYAEDFSRFAYPQRLPAD